LKREVGWSFGEGQAPLGFCPACGADKRTYAEIEAENRRFVNEYLDAMAGEGVERAQAIEFLRQDAPSLLRYVG